MAKSPAKFILDSDIPKRLKVHQQLLDLEKDGGIDYGAKRLMGLALLNFIVTGSSRESVVVPIQFGQLRGGGTVFVGSLKTGDLKNKYPKGNPANTYEAKMDTITVGFTESYTARLHETTWTPGGKNPSKQALGNPAITGDVGNKFIEKHLRADGVTLTKMYASFIKRMLNK